MKTLIISYNRFPNGDAGAVRDYVFAKMLSELGHDVCVVAMGENTEFAIKDYKGIEYVSLRNKGTDKLSKFSNYLGYTRNLYKFIKSYYFNSLPDIIWVVNMPFHSLLSIKKFSIKNHIKLVHDSVEWYSPKQFKMGKLSPSYILKDINNKYIIDKNFNVIAISKFLEEHFVSKAIKTVRVPIIFDVQSVPYDKYINKNKTTLLYAGSPGSKDYLKEIIDGLSLLDVEDLQKVELRILGISKDQVLKIINYDRNKLSILSKSIVILGRVSREIVLKNLQQADFTVLLRPASERYAKAGFPTKVVESLSSATPIICNITSDLGDYLKDMENCVIVEGCSAEEFTEAIKKGLKLSDQQKNKMYINARKCAEENFDYRKYVNNIEKVVRK